MQPPSKLYRSINDTGENQALQNHLEGILWFRAPLYFHETEGVGKDPTEGIGSYEYKNILYADVSDTRPIVSMFMLSFSETREASERFGNYHLILIDPEGLAAYLREALSSCNTRVQWEKVRYTKTMNLDSQPDPVAGWDRKYFCKPEGYAIDREWRLCLWFHERVRMLNHTLELGVGSEVRRFWKYGANKA